MVESLVKTNGQVLTAFDLNTKRLEDRRSDPLLFLDLNNFKDIIFVQDVNLQIMFASSSALSQFGYTIDEIKDLGLAKLMTSDSLDLAMEKYKQYYCMALKVDALDIPLMEYEYVRKNGSTFWGELKVNFVKDPEGNIIGSQGILRDVDERKKMESFGTLAGGIAHDLNNFLMSIEGYANLLLAKMEHTHPDFAMLSAINAHVNSCTQLTGQLLGYARNKKNTHIFFDLNLVITETIRSLKKVLSHIVIKTDLGKTLLPMKGDIIQIKQVLCNLFINAADAMPHGGELIIKTASMGYDALAACSFKPQKRNYITLKVTDTGVGMDRATRDRLFEPYFTTKQGKGIGLGLASACDIVKAHQGFIDVESQPGQGSTFSIFLPASPSNMR